MPSCVWGGEGALRVRHREEEEEKEEDEEERFSRRKKRRRRTFPFPASADVVPGTWGCPEEPRESRRESRSSGNRGAAPGAPSGSSGEPGAPLHPRAQPARLQLPVQPHGLGQRCPTAPGDAPSLGTGSAPCPGSAQGQPLAGRAAGGPCGPPCIAGDAECASRRPRLRELLRAELQRLRTDAGTCEGRGSPKCAFTEGIAEQRPPKRWKRSKRCWPEAGGESGAGAPHPPLPSQAGLLPPPAPVTGARWVFIKQVNLPCFSKNSRWPFFSPCLPPQLRLP